MATTIPTPAPAAGIPATTGSPVGSMGRMLRHAVSPTVVLNIAAPFASYEILTSSGLSELTALAVGSVFPLAGIAMAAVRSRRLEWIGVASLAGIMVGLLGGLLFGSAEFLLVKDSIITGGIGLVFLASLLAARPLVFVLGRQMPGADPAAFERQWSSAQFRHGCRQTTAVWGLALIAEAGLRIALSFLIPPATLILISPLLATAVFAPLALWTIRRRAARQRPVPAT
jgi:hypothetical protein